MYYRHLKYKTNLHRIRKFRFIKKKVSRADNNNYVMVNKNKIRMY